MSSTAQLLATKVSSVEPAEIRAIRHKAERYDTIEPRFSSRALELLEQMGDDYRYGATALRRRLSQKSNQPDPHVIKVGRRIDADGIADIIRDALFNYSVFTMKSFADPVFVFQAVPWCMDGDRQIKTTHPALLPSIFEDSLDAHDRYFQPLATAGMVLDFVRVSPMSLKDAPAFISWAGKQENMTEALECAIKINSLHPEHISSILSLQRKTHPSLHDGVL